MLASFVGWFYLTSYSFTSLLAVIEAGKSHGAQRADLYGCLYFYLTEELRKFVERLRSFHINFYIVSDDPNYLPRQLKDKTPVPYGLIFPAQLAFDRIHLSNMFDYRNKFTITGVLADWTPYLKTHEHATIIAYSMTWIGQRKADDDKDLLIWNRETSESELLRKLIKEGKVCNSLLSKLHCMAPAQGSSFIAPSTIQHDFDHRNYTRRFVACPSVFTTTLTLIICLTSGFVAWLHSCLSCDLRSLEIF